MLMEKREENGRWKSFNFITFSQLSSRMFSFPIKPFADGAKFPKWSGERGMRKTDDGQIDLGEK